MHLRGYKTQFHLRGWQTQGHNKYHLSQPHHHTQRQILIADNKPLPDVVVTPPTQHVMVRHSAGQQHNLSQDMIVRQIIVSPFQQIKNPKTQQN
jgi:hypothetical protein